MADNQPNINQPIAGLNLTSIEDQITQGFITEAQNAVVTNFDGKKVAYQNEQGNVVSITTIPKEFIILHAENVLELNQTYFWLVTKDNSKSEIGFVNHNDNIYHPLIQDTNTDKLNFNIAHPIHKVVVKVTNCSTQFYWTDGLNFRRYLDLQDLPWKTQYNPDNPSIPIPLVGDLDVNKMLVQPNFSLPTIEDIEISEDGNIIEGSYQFGIQYSNSKGESYTSVYNVSNPIAISDNSIATLDKKIPTSKAIRFKVNNIDTTGLFEYYNIIVFETIADVTTPKLLGTYPTSIVDRVITYTGNTQQNEPLSMIEVMEEFPYYDVAQDLTTSKNSLIWIDLKEQEEINYQKIWSKVKLYWVTYAIPYNEYEGYTSNNANTADYRSFLRDEVYPIHGSFFLTNGKKTNSHPLIGREATYYDTVPIPVTSSDLINFSDKDPNCSTPEEQPRWKIYNTGSKIGYCQEYIDYIASGADPNCYVGPYEYGEFAYWESERRYPNNVSIWGDLADQPIRHFKFPDANITYHYDNNSTDSKSYQHTIYPIGIKIDEVSLKDAIEQSDLTEDQKRRIKGFKLQHGNRSVPGNKSIIAKGLLNNVGVTKYDDKIQYFGNYPYNDLRPDPFFTKEKIKAHSGYSPHMSINAFNTKISKERFLLYSPDTLFTNPPLTNGYLKIDSIEYGHSYGHFKKVLDNAEYKFLTRQMLYACIGIGMTTSITLGVGTFGSPSFDTSKMIPGYNDAYKIFQDLAPFTNFGLTYHSLGLYNKHYIVPNEGNKIRNINYVRYVTDGQNSVEDSDINLNHFRREKSVYINVSDSLLFPHEYDNTIPRDTSRYCLSDCKEDNTTFETFLTEVVNTGGSTITDEDISMMYDISDTFNELYPSYKFTLNEINTSDVPQVGNTYNLQGSIYQFSIYDVQTAISSSDPTKSSGYIEGVLENKDDQWIESSSGTLILIGSTTSSSLVYDSLSLVDTSDDPSIIDVSLVRQHLQEFIDILADPTNSSSYINTFNNTYSFEYESIKELILYVFNSKVIKNNGELNKKFIEKERSNSICSYYGALKKVNSIQWGDINTYEIIDMGKYVVINNDFTLSRSPYFFGGDTFINRFSFKIKQQFFFNTTVGDKYDDQTGINYDELGVINYPMFWLSTSPEDFKIDIEEEVNRLIKQVNKIPGIGGSGTFGGKVWSTVRFFLTAGAAPVFMVGHLLFKIFKEIYKHLGIGNTNLDLYFEKSFIEQGIMYLYSYGNPYFFVESEVNLDMRKATNEKEGNFFPRVSKWIPDDWLQEVNVPIAFDNTYYYNKSLSKQHHETSYSSLRVDWDPNKTCLYQYPNRAIYSDLSSLEETKNNWLVYRPLSYFDFPKDYGTITAIDGLDNGAVLVRYYNHSQLYDTMTTIDANAPLRVYLGNDMMFKSSPPVDLKKTKTGYAGSQHKFLLSTEFGNITADSERGQILLLNGTNYEELSAIYTEEWFNNNLSFRIKQLFPTINIDNHFRNIGLHGVYDYLYKRALITKRDYDLLPSIDPDSLYEQDGALYLSGDRDSIINDKQAQGWEFIEQNGNVLRFRKEIEETSLPTNTDIHAYFDTTSMLSSDGVAAKQALTTWFNQLRNNNPTYEGNLYVIAIPYNQMPNNGAERWLRQAEYSAKGVSFISDNSTWSTLNQLPPNYQNPSNYTPPSDIIILSFVDEVQDNNQGETAYHGNTLSFINPTQRTSAYNEDYSSMLNYKAYFNSFKQVLYPINKGSGGTGNDEWNANVLQMVAALKGRILTPSEVANIPCSVNLSILTTQNPYTNPLEYQGFLGVFNKTSPASSVFSSDTFGQELTDLLDLGSVSRYYIYDEVYLDAIEIGNTNYFKNISWTMSFSFLTKSWTSYHSYIPNVYIEFPNFFQSSKNTITSSIGGYDNQTIWDHNKSFVLFNNYYNELKPYYIEQPYSYKLLDEITTHIEDYTTVLKYNNRIDSYEPDEQIFFNRGILYNSQQSTGNIIFQPKNKNDYSQYFFNPAVSTDSTTIQLTKTNNIFYYNSIWDIVISNNLPIFVDSDYYPDFRKKLNQSNHNYTQLTSEKARLRAKGLRVLHILDNRDDIKIISHIQLNPTTSVFR